MQTRRSLLELLVAGSAAGPATAAPHVPGTHGRIGSNSNAIVLSAGIHRVDSNIVLKADVLVLPGAQIHIAANKTLTLLGDFQAPVTRVFFGEGRVDMQRSRVPAAYPEWWGAAKNDPGVDCQPALRACVEAHQICLLGTGDYYIADTWKITLANRRIWGAGRRGIGSGQGTRIVMSSPERDVVQVGFSIKPNGPNDFLRNVDLRYLDLARAQAAKGTDLDDWRGAAGLRIRFVLDCHFESISACEHAIGFSTVGAVRSFFVDCEAFFSAGGSGRYCGFYLDGRTDIGLAGGNASIYILNCNVTAGGPACARTGIGAFLQGAFADTYLQNFETSAIAIGIRVDGTAGALSPARQRSGHADLHIFMPIIDQFAQAGIELANLSRYAMVDVVDPYLAPARGGNAAFYWHDSHGLVSISGGQLLGWVDAEGGGNALGLYGQRAEGLSVSGLKLLDFKRPIGLDGCGDFDIVAAVNNPGQTAAQGAVWVKDCVRGYLRPRIKGRAGAFPQGVFCAGKNNYGLTIDVTGVDPQCIVGGVDNRVQLDHRAMKANPALGGNVVVLSAT